MILLIPLLLVTPTIADIPPIDGLNRGGWFNYMHQKFEERRLYVGIVDTLSSPPAEQQRAPSTTVFIDLIPSENDPEYYEFVSRKISLVFKCDEAGRDEFEDQTDLGEYYISINETTAKAITRGNEDNEGEEMMRRIARLAGMKEEKIAMLGLFHCARLYEPTRMRIRVTEDVRSQIQSGWVVERYPLGNFSFNNDGQHYRYPVYRSNHSYIDGKDELIVDVHQSIDDTGTRVWTPTGWPTFAKQSVEHVDFNKIEDFSFIRETSTGLLIATTVPSMSLWYTIDDDGFNEEIKLAGHHFHVSCDYKLGTHPFTEPYYTLMLVTLGSSNFKCNRSRATPTGVPEVLQLDYMQTSGSHTVPSSYRHVTIESSGEHRPKSTTQPSTSTTQHSTALVEMTSVAPEIAATTELNRNQDKPLMPYLSELSWSEFVFAIILLVCFLITLIAFVCKCIREYIKKSHDPVVRAWINDRHGEDRRREDGRYSYFSNRELAETSRQSMEAINKKCEEREAEERKQSSLSFTGRPRSLRKSSSGVTFAPREKALNNEEQKALHKTIDDIELGVKIDAMIAAGPDPEDEEFAGAAPAAVAAEAAPEPAAEAAPKEGIDIDDVKVEKKPE